MKHNIAIRKKKAAITCYKSVTTNNLLCIKNAVSNACIAIPQEIQANAIGLFIIHNAFLMF